jgi:hypothetical protein
VPDADQAEALVPAARPRGRPDEIVKGWEVTKGQFVVVEDADLEALERATTRARSRSRASSARAVDPVYFDRTYFLARTGSGRAAALRAPARRDARDRDGRDRALRARGSEYLCLIRPKGDALALETLFLAEDVHSQAEIDEAVADADVQRPELELARQVIASLAASSTRPRSRAVPARPAGAARGEARGRRAREAGARRGGAGGRPARGAARERRAGLEEEAEGGGGRGEEVEERRLRLEDASATRKTG